MEHSPPATRTNHAKVAGPRVGAYGGCKKEHGGEDAEGDGGHFFGYFSLLTIICASFLSETLPFVNSFRTFVRKTILNWTSLDWPKVGIRVAASGAAQHFRSKPFSGFGPADPVHKP